MLALLPRPLRPRRRRRRRAERAAVLHPAGHPQAGRRAGAPRAPRAVAGRLPRADRPGRLVDREPARAAALPALPVRRGLAGHPRRAARPRRRRGPRIAVVHNGTDPVVPTSTPARPRTPTVVRRGPAGAAQAGRARHRRGRSRCAPSSPTCGCTSSAAAGGRPSCTRTPRSAGAGDTVVFEGHVDEAAQARDLRAGLGDGAALAQGGLGAGRRRGRHAHGTPTVAYRAAGGTRESIDDGRSGVLVDDPQRVHGGASGRCCADDARRARARRRAPRVMSHRFTWEHAQAVVRRGGRRGAAGRAGRQPGPVESSDPSGSGERAVPVRVESVVDRSRRRLVHVGRRVRRSRWSAS